MKQAFRIEDDRGCTEMPLQYVLENLSLRRRLLKFRKYEVIFSQGDAADALFQIKDGRVKLSVVSSAGKEATLLILGSGEFFGFGCLSHQRHRLGTATTLASSTVFRFEKSELIKALHEQPRLFELVLAHVSSRNVELQKDLCAQIFDLSERRLARILLKLTPRKKNGPEPVAMPRISHDTLASMVGTTRSRITYFMNQFRRQGLIDYENGVRVHPSRLIEALQED